MQGTLCWQLCKLTGERPLIHYDLLAISRVLPTVPKIRLSCILCIPVCVHRTGRWFPLRRSEDRGHSIRPACACRTQTGGLLSILF